MRLVLYFSTMGFQMKLLPDSHHQAPFLMGFSPRVRAHKQSSKPHTKPRESNGHQWLMPVILATQEAEIRRIMVGSLPGQIVCETLSQKNPSQK
jgi:hypothetical protein